MTRHVVAYDMVAHLWANRSQDWARNSHDSFSFRGDSLKSYSTEIARLMRDTEGRTVVLHINRSFSVTTSKQQSIARRAASQYKSFDVPDVDPLDHKDNVAYFVKLYDTEVARLRDMGWKKFAREHQEYGLVPLLVSLYADVQDYAVTFGLDCPERNPVEDVLKIQSEQHAKCTPLALAKYRDELLRRQQERDAREHMRDAHQAEQQRLHSLHDAERLAEWRAGANIVVGSYYATLPDGTAALRKGETPSGVPVLETSMGAQVPWLHALRVFQACLECRQLNRGIHPSIKAGQFTVTEIRSDGSFTAGCHRIGWPEIERLAIETDNMPEEAAEIAWAKPRFPIMSWETI